VNGVCRPIGAAKDSGPQAQYRSVGCTERGEVVIAGVISSGSCGPNVPRCTLLVEGGQPGPHPPVAYEYQRLDPGESTWLSLGFWCPQSQRPTPVPDAATIRDQVIKLLPKVAIATTGSPATLVNVQTVLWADTTARRSLGRVVIVGQPVWLHLAFDHGTWDFGDGTTDTSTTPGKVYDSTGDPCAEVLCPDYYGHVYRKSGPMTISLTVSWNATYSLDGTHFQPVDPAALTGPATTHALTVREARAVLVPDPGGH
jgi:hypothetical protein